MCDVVPPLPFARDVATRTVVGDFLATTDDSGELMDTFHLFSDESEGGGESAGGGGGGAGGEDTNGDQARASAAADGQKMPKLKALDGEAFASCLEMCFEHMVRERGVCMYL